MRPTTSLLKLAFEISQEIDKLNKSVRDIRIRAGNTHDQLKTARGGTETYILLHTLHAELVTNAELTERLIDSRKQDLNDLLTQLTP